MPARHHRLTRAGSASVTVATALVTTAGLASPLVASAYAVTTGVTIAAPDADVDRRFTVVASGRLGVLYQQEGTDGYVWSSSRKVVPALGGVPAKSILDTYDYDNRVVYSTTADDGSITITAYNLETGYTYSFQLPSGYQHPHMSSGFALASHQLDDGTYEYRIVRPNGSGGVYDTQVQLPAGATAEAEPKILATVDGGADFVIRYQKDGRAAYGTVKVTGAAAVQRDYAGSDGIGELLTLTSSGALSIQKGDGKGGFLGKVTGSGWATSVKAVPFGDLDGDGRGDLLVQDKSNKLWRYSGTASGTFKARVKIFDNWGSSYNTVIGVGDITGDGLADLVARDTSGALWRTNGTGKGSFGARTKIGTGWGTYKGLF
ncbi:FG-GAP repeat domain-containing protein [Streptomyces sp. NPDC001165]|uniref:FG-GAP repeat domain-containing protein n=1 Tax=Streptomyces sp. NPDC001165 TaxID=3364546 RepID=UPI003692A56E